MASAAAPKLQTNPVSNHNHHHPGDGHNHCRHETDRKPSSTIRLQWDNRGLPLLHRGSAHIAFELIPFRTVTATVAVTECLQQHPPSNSTRFGQHRQQQLDVDIDGRPRSICPESRRWHRVSKADGEREGDRVQQCPSRNTPNVRNENPAPLLPPTSYVVLP